jgi:hypothetical protein
LDDDIEKKLTDLKMLCTLGRERVVDYRGSLHSSLVQFTFTIFHFKLLY